MGIIPISAVTNPTSTTAPRGPSNTLDDQGFMNLLVAQLTNQNPLQPSDPDTFMQETASMTMVQQLQQMAQDSTANTQSQQTLTAAAMVGKQITWNDAHGNELSGVVTTAKLGSAGANLVVGTGPDAATVPLSGVVSVSTPPAPAPAAPAPTSTAPAPAASTPAPSTSTPAPSTSTPAPAASTPAPSTTSMTLAAMASAGTSDSSSDTSSDATDPGDPDLAADLAAPAPAPAMASSASYQIDPTAYALAGLSALSTASL